jgi:hypothetical protein
MDQLSKGKFFMTFSGLEYPLLILLGYPRIPVHLVFDIKESLQKESRMVAGGHVTKPLKESVYSGVASLRSLRLVIFLAELNGLPTMQGDIGNAYLTSDTAERVCFRAGPALYVLWSSVAIPDLPRVSVGWSVLRSRPHAGEP